ncbi:MAG: DJ-1/PfpI family protein [Treponema sp.]|nr:DJ-1/PfpI family protein [Treponema sp.]
MKKAIILLANGFEEIEAVVPADLMRRAGIEVDLVAVEGTNPIVTGSRSISLCANSTFDKVDSNADAVVIPGGMAGANALAANLKVGNLLTDFFAKGKLVCAICAAPAVVLAPLGILDGKDFTCYPEMEKEIPNCKGNHKIAPVVVDENLITSRGPGTASHFAFAIIEKLCGKEVAEKVTLGTLY